MASKTIKKTPAKTTATKRPSSRARKVAVKKVAAAVKKTNLKTKSKAKRNSLVNALNHECFWTTDGRVLGNLEELFLAFTSMTEGVYSYHVNQDKNDFANWVEHVLGQAACATDLRGAKTAKKAATVAKKHLR